MPIDYGIQSEYTSSDTELFTEVDNQLKLATERASYQPYFERFQQSATTEYFNNLQKLLSSFISSIFLHGARRRLGLKITKTIICIKWLKILILHIHIIIN